MQWKAFDSAVKFLGNIDSGDFRSAIEAARSRYKCQWPMVERIETGGLCAPFARIATHWSEAKKQDFFKALDGMRPARARP